MPRIRRSTPDGAELAPLLEMLRASGDGAPSLAEKIALVHSFRGTSEQADRELDQYLIGQNASLLEGLREAEGVQAKLRRLLDKLAAPPWFPGVFLGWTETPRGRLAHVAHDGSRRVVSCDDEAPVDSLVAGDEVFLGQERNVIVAVAPRRSDLTGETAIFDRATPDNRLIVRIRDEELVIDAADDLKVDELKSGDLLRWQRQLWMAFEKLERSGGEQRFVEQAPADTFDDIGGLKRQIRRLRRTFDLYIGHAGLVQKRGAKKKGALLLFGPPGTGKTLLARAIANFLGRYSASGIPRFIHIKPSSLCSMWYGQTEHNIRELFRVAREVADRDSTSPVVIFFDEVDALGAARSTSLNRVDDRVLPAFMAELDGFEGRGNLIVIAATNRADALDPALLRGGRLNDLALEIPRPGREGTRAIFERHLPEEMPLHGAADAGQRPAAKNELLDAVVSSIFAPNADAELARLTFRDGKRRAVHKRDLISGASIAKISGDAVERGLLREVDGQQAGVRLDDYLAAAQEEFESAAGFLTAANCSKHISGLPQDVDVVSVEPLRRKVRQPQRYLRSA